MTRAVATASCFLVSAMAIAQPATNTPAFDVASVKPAGPNSRMGADFRIFPDGTLTITNLSLKTIIEEAFQFDSYQITGGPGWLEADRFDIIAKADGNPDRKRVIAMLRTLLTERFQLKIRYETTEGRVYALKRAKNGPKLTPPTGDRARIQLQRTGSTERPAVTNILVGQKASLAMLAAELGRHLHRPVLDRTGIKGDFDFRLEYAPHDSETDAGPSIITAIQEQLGLKLEATKGPVATLVIDHAGKPSAN